MTAEDADQKEAAEAVLPPATPASALAESPSKKKRG